MVAAPRITFLVSRLHPAMPPAPRLFMMGRAPTRNGSVGRGLGRSGLASRWLPPGMGRRPSAGAVPTVLRAPKAQRSVRHFHEHDCVTVVEEDQPVAVSAVEPSAAQLAWRRPLNPTLVRRRDGK